LIDETISLLQAAFRVFSTRAGRILAGALAFSTLLSVVPLLVIALRVASLIIDGEVAHATLVESVARWVGPEGARTLDQWVLAAASSGKGVGLLGAAVLAYGSTRLFATLTRAFDMLWGVDTLADSTWKEKAESFIARRLFAFGLVLVVGVMLVALVLSHALLEAARDFSATVPIARVLEYLVSFVTTAALFSALYIVLPSKRVPLKIAAAGGVATALLFTVGAVLVGAYVGHKGSDSPFGAASSLVLLLLWVHYSAHTFLYGAAITVVLTERKPR
jgi:membrane protein